MMFKPKYQKYKHEIDKKIAGDCDRTAIAYMMRRDRDSVPHFFKDHLINTSDEHHEKILKERKEWIRKNGYEIVEFAITCPDEKILMKSISYYNPSIEYMVIGESPRGGFNHIVVCKDGKVIFDPWGPLENIPHPIIGPCVKTNHFFVEFLIKKG